MSAYKIFPETFSIFLSLPNLEAFVVWHLQKWDNWIIAIWSVETEYASEWKEFWYTEPTL